MKSPVLVSALLALGLLVPEAACARACEPGPAEAAAHAAPADASPCHGAPETPAPAAPEGTPHSDACPLCAAAWLSAGSDKRPVAPPGVAPLASAPTLRPQARLAPPAVRVGAAPPLGERTRRGAVLRL